MRNDKICKKKAFTLIELLIVIGIMSILFFTGGVSIKRHRESTAMLRIKNEVGDFFRLEAKRAKESRKRYEIDFELEKKRILIKQNELVINRLELPSTFEYMKISKGKREQTLKRDITSTGNINMSLTLYVFQSNFNKGIQGDELAKYAIVLKNNDEHVRYLHVKERIPKLKIRAKEIKPSENGSKDASKKSYWEEIRG